MKTVNSILFLTLINTTLILSQNYYSNVNTASGQSETSHSQSTYEFNPLHVGDVWQYRFEDTPGQSKYYSIRIVKDSIINGKQYFKKVDWRYEARPPLSIVKFISWERNDSISGASYMLDFEDIDEDGDTTEEFLLDSLQIPNISVYESYKYSFKGVSDALFIGKKNAMIKYTYWSEVYGDTVLVKLVEYLELFIEEQIADKFGIVSMRQESPDRFLTGAIINGKKYGTIVSVDEDLSELPQNYKLFPNYPNPFNNSTKITYQIPSLTKVELIITDILGRTIKTLVDEEKAAGVYNVNFTAENLSSGVYFCTLVTNNIQTIKMIFLK